MDMERIKAFVRLAIPLYSLVNAYLLASGVNPLPFTEEEASAFVNGAIGLAGTLYVWYKNNNITKEAQEAQRVLDKSKRDV